MTSSIKIRTQPSAELTELKLLISHPMENGRNRDPATNELIPAHFIRELTLDRNQSRLLTVKLGQSMSKNPFFSFQLKNCQSGDRLSVNWIDNLGNTDYAEHIID